ncbi:MAG TPA: hypothetical protein VEG27_01685 [Usitatibacter sp.]|nr:hypothetical protein [Usitatibacter sp.]
MRAPSVVSAELALGMALALESSESDIGRAQALLLDPLAASEPALQLLARALARIETVRLALDEAGTRSLD